MPAALINESIFPSFRQHFNGNGFMAGDLLSALRARGENSFDRKMVANWLGNEVRRPGTVLMRASVGHYTFKPAEVVDETPTA
jgi:hypothetical protein